MPTDSNCCGTTGLPTPTVVGPALTQPDPCAAATLVKICGDLPASTPTTLTGEDCAGTPQSFAVTAGGYAVQPAGHVFNVKLCNTVDVYDREMQILCAPDGTKVAIQNTTASDAPLGTAPTFDAWTLSGAPYTGNIALLQSCVSADTDLITTPVCIDGVSATRTDFLNTSTQKVEGVLWQDASGATIPTPAAGTYYLGYCTECAAATPLGVLTTWGI